MKAINSDKQRPTVSARTNDLDEFRLVDLPVGRYFLQVSPLSGDLEPQTTDPIDMRNIVQQEGVDIRVPRAASGASRTVCSHVGTHRGSRSRPPSRRERRAQP